MSDPTAGAAMSSSNNDEDQRPIAPVPQAHFVTRATNPAGEPFSLIDPRLTADGPTGESYYGAGVRRIREILTDDPLSTEVVTVFIPDTTQVSVTFTRDLAPYVESAVASPVPTIRIHQVSYFTPA